MIIDTPYGPMPAEAILRFTSIARHWSNQTDKGKGIRFEADALNLLNAVGLGERAQNIAAELQRTLCQERNGKNHSISEVTSASCDARTEPTSRLSGMTPAPDGIAALARVRRRLRTAA